MKNRLRVLFFGFLIFGHSLFAQDTSWARQQLNLLAADEMAGRGYTHDGALRAARHIVQEFRGMGLESFHGDYLQEYHFPINTLVGDIVLNVDGKELITARDFMVSLSSPSIQGRFDLVYFLDDSLKNTDRLENLKNQDLDGKALVVDAFHRDFLQNNPTNAPIIIYRAKAGKKLVWSVSRAFEVKEFVGIQMLPEALPVDAQNITISVGNHFLEDYKSYNVAAYEPGITNCDTMIVFTAHYDHLGEMGKGAIFNGANDNASGTAMVLTLAKYFSEEVHQPDCPVAFVLFSGEEAGLLGSSYMAEHPLFDLGKVRYLINLDMVGTGSEGITIVNGATEPLFDKMVALNEEFSLLAEVKPRGVSCNSDHCPFSEKGVSSVFIYTRGPEFSEYHNLDDRPEHLPLTAFWELSRLLIEVVENGD